MATPIYIPRNGLGPATFNARRFGKPLDRYANLVPNNIMTGAALGSPGVLPNDWSVYVADGGITTEIVSLSNDPIPLIGIRYSGIAASAAFKVIRWIPPLTIAGVVGQRFVHSAMIYSVVNVGVAPVPLRIGIVQTDGAGVVVGSSMTSANINVNTVNPFRLRQAVTLNQPTVAYIFGGIFWACSIGDAIDFTIVMGLQTLEADAVFMGPPMLTN